MCTSWRIASAPQRSTPSHLRRKLAAMSAHSMTGFGRAMRSRKGLHVEVEVRSVNRRQLDLVLHVPKDLQPLEPRIEEMVARAVHRGHVTVVVKVVSANGTPPRVELRERLAEAYVHAFRRLARRFRLDDTLDLRTLLAIPDLWRVQDPERNPTVVWPLVRDALSAALRRMIAMRRAEGAVLVRDLARRLQRMHRQWERWLREAPRVLSRRQRELLQRVKELDQARPECRAEVARHVAELVERMDVTEELTRLGSHMQQMRAILQRRTPCGRTLDFLAQEMLRESHTLLNKISDACFQAALIEFKAEVERIREQVQNLE